MGKTKEMAMLIDELRAAAVAINDVASQLAEKFGGGNTEKPTTTDEPVLTLEEVRAVLAEKSRNGYTAEVRSLLQKYGADKLSGIDPVQYKALLADAEVLGNGD